MYVREWLYLEINCEDMVGFKKNRSLWFNLHEEKGTFLKRNSWNSNPWHH
jgi:hypothetical protein